MAKLSSSDRLVDYVLADAQAAARRRQPGIAVCKCALRALECLSVRVSAELQVLCAAVTRRLIRATLELLPTDRGGRAGQIQSGYRSLARFEGLDADFGFELELAQPLAPGAEGTGLLSFWATDELPELSIGQRFELREGARVVGHATIHDPSAGPSAPSVS